MTTPYEMNVINKITIIVQPSHQRQNEIERSKTSEKQNCIYMTRTNRQFTPNKWSIM